MRHSIFSVILLGILLGATFFFMPQLVLGIFILFVIIRLLHVAFMGHRWYGHGYYGHAYGHGYGYGTGCDCGYGYNQGYESDCNCGHGHYQDHHHGHGPMKGHMLHFAFMGHGYYGHGYYGSGRGCEYEYGRGYGSGCDCDRAHEFHYDHHHHHGFGPIQGPLFHWADKIRNMSEEEFTEFKNKMDKGFGFDFHGRNYGRNKDCNCRENNEAAGDSDSGEKKEETTKL